MCVLTTFKTLRLMYASAKNASSLNGIERKSSFLFCFFLVLKVVRYRRRWFVFTNSLFCSRPQVFFDKTTKTLHVRIKKTVLANNLANTFFLINTVNHIKIHTIMCIWTSDQFEPVLSKMTTDV